MLKDLTVCPICSIEDLTSKFVVRKPGKFIDQIIYICPSCKRELALKEKDKKLIFIMISLSTLFFIGLFITDVPKSIVGIIFSIIFCCLWIIKKIGLLNDLFKIQLIPQDQQKDS